MRHLNYNHLLYFWTVAREGSIAKASVTLHLTPQTISGQLKLLEESIGEPLFNRVGRGLVLSDTGQMVNQYADEIFSLGAELAQRVRDNESAPVRLTVGIVNSIAKLIAYRVLQPAMEGDDSLRIICREGNLEPLLGELAVHQLDLVISDRPIPARLNVKAYNHRLGASELSLFAPRKAAPRYRRDYPGCLNGASMLMPMEGTALRRDLDEWLDQQELTPKVVAEFEDSALMKAFADAGTGLMPAPSAIREHVERVYEVREIGTVDGVLETYYAISPERKLKHPAVVSIINAARNELFG